MYGSAAPHWQHFGARGPSPQKRRIRCAREALSGCSGGAGGPPVKAGWGRARSCSKTLPAGCS
eukprot:6058171-Alexandrium_andersonii.AAC.1